MAPVTVTVELPVTAGNEFQGKSTSFRIVVEAVQGNAVVEDNREPVIEHVSAVADQADLDAALAGTEPAVITVVKDMALTVGGVANKTFKVEGNDVAFTFNGLMENVVVEGIEAKTAGTKINLKNATGDITVLDSSFISAGGKHAGASIALGMNADLTVDDCVFVGGGAADYALSTSGSSGSVGAVVSGGSVVSGGTVVSGGGVVSEGTRPLSAVIRKDASWGWENRAKLLPMIPVQSSRRTAAAARTIAPFRMISSVFIICHAPVGASIWAVAAESAGVLEKRSATGPPLPFPGCRR
jgi:hypothetical protein